MPNSINSISPSFRDYLLLKNLVTDTVVDNGLQSLLSGIGYPVSTETLPNAVQPSNSINNTGPLYQELNTILNTYQGNDDDYSQVEIVLNQSTNNTIGNQGIYANSNELLNGQFVYNGGLTNSESIREGLTSKNIYVDVPKQSVINLNTQPVPTFQNLTSYIDENNNLSIGGPGTQAADVLAGLVSGQGVGLNVTNGSLIANGDIRSSLLGRTLGATGVINDTPLGNVGGQQLLAHVGYNAAFGLQQETLGKLNLNPLTLIQGKPLVTLNYSITVPKGTLGKIVNFAANVFGVQSPKSLLEESSSIFTFSDKLKYIGQSNIERANEMIANTGKGQVQSLMDHMRANVMASNDPQGTSLRQGYAPGYKDGRKSKGEETGDGTNSYLYARANNEGGIIDFLNGKENSPISSGNYQRSEQISADGWNEDYFNTNIKETFGDTMFKDGFTWYSEKVNNQNDVDANGDSLGDKFGKTENSKKTLLYKTQSLFKSGNIKSLVSGHGIVDVKSQINSSVSSIGGYTSKGSGVMSSNAILNGNDNGPENVFCRTWTSNDRYNTVSDLQKNKGLYGATKNIFRQNTEFSVLDDNGFVKISPLKNGKDEEVKKYMFSIENLAWNDNLLNLLECEKGPGDPLSGHKGRIMWFPPYDINFSETTSASWDKHNFIGRGEPMYTYNNTERTGNLSWKIIIDHPNYLNFVDKNKGNFDDYIASFFAGCIPLEDTLIGAITTKEEQDKAEVANAQQQPVIKVEEEKEPDPFKVYFPNDVYNVDEYPFYEDGLCYRDDALFTLSDSNGAKFSPDGTKVVTSSNQNKANIWDASNGNSLITLYTNAYTNNASFSPDGTKVITATPNQNKANIWDASNGGLLFTLLGHTDIVYHVEFSPDNTKVATASKDKTAKIWDVSNGSLLFTLLGHTESVFWAKFSPDNTKVVTASKDNTAKIWDVSNGSLLFTLSGHTGNVTGVNFSPDGTKVVTASTDKTAKIWDVSNGGLLFTLLGHTDTVYTAEFSPDGTKVVTASYDKTAKIWDVSNGSLLFTLLGHTDYVYSAKFSPDGTKVVTASQDTKAKIWDVSNGGLLFTLLGHTSYVETAEFSPDGTKVVTASGDDTAKIFDASTGIECYINYKTNPTGENFGLGTYNELCYEFTVDGRKKWSSTLCSNTPNVTQGDLGRVEPDRTNFGLNATGTTEEYTGTRLNGKKYPSWRDPQYAKDLQNYLLTKCKHCKIEVVGYASTVGTFGDNRNDELSKLRAESVKDWLLANIITDPPFTERVSVVAKSKGATEAGGGTCPESPASRSKDYLKSTNDVYGCKANRYVSVTFVVDPALKAKEEAKGEKTSGTITPPKINTLPIPLSRFYSECDYFQKLGDTDPIAYSSIKDKIKYFQPAFHSTTPEGFNARLNFLQQCMRQGPTNGGGVTNNPNNLAFGRPPVCILRIGDFYNTKIIIENLNFTFEPLVWDLNPEGVGVQPMICNVDMSFSFIGGSSLRGPINKLQNAVSFNYFANSEVYDPRADTIKITDSVKNTGEIKNGINYSSYNILPDGPYITGLGPNTEPTKNQVAENNNANSQNNTEIGDLPKLTAINFISVLHSSSMNDSTGKQNDIVIKMDSENIITGGFVVESTVKPFVEQGIKITITSIPIPNFITNVVIDNKFNYEEIVKFDDGNQKSISALVSTGYRIGDNVGGNYSLTIPNGLYSLTVTHASVVISKATIEVGKSGGFYYPSTLSI